MNASGLVVETTCRHTNASPVAGVDVEVSESLLQLLAGLECPILAKTTFRGLARRSQERLQLQALADLWQSLGLPPSVFWRPPRVFYNRIVDSYALMP